MISPALDAEPALPGPDRTPAGGAPVAAPTLRVERRTIDGIRPATWDALAARNPWATLFSGWAFQRAWWDAYGANAHEETLAVVPIDAAPGADPIAIIPLMHRHEVEPADELTHTTIRHGADIELTPVPPTATAVFFGASYHADYATILAAPADLPAVSDALADYLAAPSARRRWDVVDSAGCAVAIRRRPRWRPPRCPGVRRRLDAERRAGGRLPGRDPAGRRDDGRLPRGPWQEGAPRDPPQGPPRPGRR